MKAGSFNINDYLDKLYEQAEDGNIKGDAKNGMIIPDENKRSFDWLRKEFEKGKTEVKVEMSSHEFKPGYSNDSVKDFKPGMYGQVKTSENNVSKDNAPKFPETKFPNSSDSKTNTEGGPSDSETKDQFGDKKDKKKSSSVKVDVRTKKEEDKEDKKEKDEEKDE